MRSEPNKPLDDKTHLATLAAEEGWLTPPPDIQRIKFRPWQKAVFWGLRIYIVVMLAVMLWGFYLRLSH